MDGGLTSGSWISIHVDGNGKMVLLLQPLQPTRFVICTLEGMQNMESVSGVFFQEAARTRTNSFQYKTYMLKVESKSIYIDINIFLYLYILYVYVCGNKEYMLHRCVSVLIWQIKDQSSSNLFHILGFIVNQVKLVRFLLHDLEIWSTTKELNKLSLNQPKWSLLMGYLPADGVMPAALHSV